MKQNVGDVLSGRPAAVDGQGFAASSLARKTTAAALDVGIDNLRRQLRLAGDPALAVAYSGIRIAIIGAGNVGRTLGTAWSAGHDITYAVRSPDDPKYADLGAPVATNDAAASASEVVVLATPWQATEQAVKDCGDLTGKVLIDCTNPLTPDFTALEVGHTTSGAEQVAKWAPGARVCKAMNQIGAPMMDRPELPGKPVMFVCGDDDAAKAVTGELVAELGFEAVDAGDLTLARLLEPYALIWIHLALRRGFGTNFGFGLLRGS
jgi:predicted dinucleotide-binding enzyme